MNAYACVAIIAVAFCGLVGFAVWFLESGWPLAALLLFIGLKVEMGDKEEDDHA